MEDFGDNVIPATSPEDPMPVMEEQIAAVDPEYEAAKEAWFMANFSW